MANPNYEASLQFLRWAYPEGPWVLVAIPVDRKGLKAITLGPGKEPQLLAWLAGVGDDHNIYWTVNRLMRDIATKPRRDDILSMDFLHVDIDPRAGEELNDERKRILAQLQSFDPAPSCIVFSGGGYQGFWRLTEPVPIKGQESAYQDAKRYNLELELLLGGDSCHNVDRIMRLPGTLNRPDKKKIAKGRTKQLAEVIEQNDRAYPIAQFKAAAIVQGGDKGFAGETVKISGNVQRVTDLGELPVGELCKVVIAQGTDPDDPNRWPSRSEPLFWVCCELVRAEVKDETIYAILTDPEWAISASVLEMGSKAESYAIRQIERAKEEAIDPWLRELNEKWAVVMTGGKTRLITEEFEPMGDTVRSFISMSTFQDFENFYRNKYVEVASGDKVLQIPVGKWWLNHPKRREYASVVFNPGRETPGSYNLWRGFSYVSRPGDCSLYLQHVRDNICGGKEELFKYLTGWMASAVQKPAQPGHTSIVLRGRQGTGKGVFANMFGALFGRHFLAVRDSNHLFGQFNAHLRDCVVLFCDEAFWAGNKKHEGMLKSLVTESTVVIEAKNIDASNSANYLHLIMASNEEWVVPAGLDDRRFLVLDVSDARMQDSSFFKEMNRQMKGGGYEALLHYLMSVDLSQFNVRSVPKTQALQDQKIRSMSNEQEWWMSKLLDGRLFESDSEWRTEVPCSELQYDFITQSRMWSKHGHSSSVKLGMFLRSAMHKGGTRQQIWGEHHVRQTDGTIRPVVRPYVYIIPSLEECRKWWDDHFGGPYDWPEIIQLEKPVEEEPF